MKLRPIVFILIFSLLFSSVFVSANTDVTVSKNKITITKAKQTGNVLEITGEIENGIYNSDVGLVIYDDGGNIVHIDQTKTQKLSGVRTDVGFSFRRVNTSVSMDDFTAVISSKGSEKKSVNIERTEVKEFFVSTDYDPENADGSFEAPFGTIEDAIEAVRQYKAEFAGNLPADVVVYLRDGEYVLAKGISLTENDSANNGKTITYSAYPGETPRIIASSAEITGWKQNGNVWKASTNISGLFGITDGNTMVGTPARYPNSGYIKAVKISDPSQTGNDWGSYNKFKENKNDNIPPISDDSQLFVSIWPNEAGWYNWFQNITPVNIETGDDNIRTFNYPDGKSAPLRINTGSRYLLMGAREFLDTNGEFYFVPGEKAVEFIPPEGYDMSEDTVLYAAAGYNAISLSGTEDNKISGICFKGLDITGVSRLRAAINMTNAEDIEIEDCRIHDVLGYGIYASGNYSNLIVDGCEISNTGSEGIYFNASVPVTLNNTQNTGSTGYVSGRCVITNNHIFKSGTLEGHASGVQLRNSRNDTVSYNTIHGIRRSGIQLNETIHRGDVIGKTIDGTLVTEDNAHQYTGSCGNTIEYNDVYDCMSDCQDGGIIYTVSHGNTIRYNHLHDSICNMDHIEGLYLDAGSSNNIVYGNAVYNVRLSNTSFKLLGVYLIGGSRNIVINNISANNEVGNVGSVFRVDGPNCVLKNNISYNSGTRIIRASNISTTFGAGENCNNNIYYNTNGNSDWAFLYPGDGGTANDNKLNLSQWRALGYELNSATSDPGFIAPEKDDFRFKDTSIAHSMGFDEILSESIGVGTDYIYSSGDELKKLFIRVDGDNKNRGLYASEGISELKLSVLARDGKGLVTNASVSFSSDNTSVARVSPSGIVTILKPGTAKITVNSGSISTVMYIKVTPDFIWFTNESGEGINKIPSNTATVTAGAYLEDVMVQNADIKIAVYNGDTLVGVTDSFTENNREYTAKIDLSKISPFTHIKAFFWEKDSFKPLLKSSQISK